MTRASHTNGIATGGIGVLEMGQTPRVDLEKIFEKHSPGAAVMPDRSWTLTDLSRAAAFHKTITRRMLTALARHGYVQQDGSTCGKRTVEAQ